MNTDEPTLSQLIEKFLMPIKGHKAQVELIRFMTRHLNIGPESVRGFPRIDKVRDEIKTRLSMRLLEMVQVNSSDELTYHKRTAEGGWDKGTRCKVVRVNRGRLTLNDKGRINGQAVPLYCSELLTQVGAEVDFTDLSTKAIALRK